MHKILSLIHLTIGFLVFLVVLLIILPFIFILSLLPGRLPMYLSFVLLRFWCWAISISMLIFFKSYHREHAPATRSYIYVANHGSYLDALAALLSINQLFKPLGKISLAKVPLFGIIYRHHVVLIDRDRAESRARGVMDLKKELAEGMSVLVFPEGTMNRTEAVLAPFYDGAFRIAIETQTPIAPLAIVNARECLPRAHPLKTKPGLVKVVYGEVIETAGMTQEDLEELKERVFRVIEKVLKRE